MQESNQNFIISYSSLDIKQFSQKNFEDLFQIKVQKTNKGLSLSKSG